LGEPSEPVQRALREIIAPLVEADGGVLYLVRRPTGLRLHLAGTCGGCPGVRTTVSDVIEPAIRAAGFRGELEITSGWIVPEAAERIGAEAPTTARMG
jgi:Fe-S cluster biogenesis protein NfuA